MNKLENNGENDNCGVVFSAFVLFILLFRMGEQWEVFWRDLETGYVCNYSGK